MKPWLVCSALLFSGILNAWSEVLQKYQTGTVPLSTQNHFFRNHPAPDFWNLISYYIPQQDGSACGIASMTMVMNSLKARQKKSASDSLVTQKVFVEKTSISYSRGLTLEQLRSALEKGLLTYSIKAKLELLYADGTPEQKRKIRKLLLQNEQSSGNLILANFNQGIFTGDPEGGGHISPIGAFDSQSNQVLILDVDREYYEPYWISLDRLIQGMNTKDPVSGKNRGLILIETL